MSGQAAIDGPALLTTLDGQGVAVIPGLLDATECRALAARYDDADGFRSRVIMQSHGVSRLRSGCRHTLGIIFHDAT